MPFILSSIRSTTRATASDLNYAERQPATSSERSMNNIAQHPRYRKAILRIGESNNNLNVCYLNRLYTKHTIRFSFISYCIALDKCHHCRPGSEQYDWRCIYPNGHLHLLLHFTFFRPTNLSSSHRSSVYLSSASGLLC
jgi:hypothetical protein